MTEGVSRSEYEKDTESEVDADYHLLVAGVVRFPPPPCWPKEHQGAERHADAPNDEE